MSGVERVLHAPNFELSWMLNLVYILAFGVTHALALLLRCAALLVKTVGAIVGTSSIAAIFANTAKVEDSELVTDALEVSREFASGVWSRLICVHGCTGCLMGSELAVVSIIRCLAWLQESSSRFKPCLSIALGCADAAANLSCPVHQVLDLGGDRYVDILAYGDVARAQVVYVCIPGNPGRTGRG